MRTLAFFAAVAGGAVLASAMVPPATIAAERADQKRAVKAVAKKPVNKTKTPVRAARTPAIKTLPNVSGAIPDQFGKKYPSSSPPPLQAQSVLEICRAHLAQCQSDAKKQIDQLQEELAQLKQKPICTNGHIWHLPNAPTIDCSPYRCQQMLDQHVACMTSCTSVDDCAPGFVCVPGGTCVPPS
jgi:hypothetical protein